MVIDRHLSTSQVVRTFTMAEQNIIKTTHVYKKCGSLELSLDVLTPSKTVTPDTAIIHYHGGFLVIGNKEIWPPAWLIDAAKRRNWAYITPNYRLLPEASGDEVLSDALDAAQWVIDNITRRVIIAGSSAGGYLAVATTAQLISPRPVAVLSVYGMLDFSHPRYLNPGFTPMHLPTLPQPVLDRIMHQIAETKGQNVTGGYQNAPDPSKDPRMGWILALHQAAAYPQQLTGVAGMAQKLKDVGLDAVQPEHRKFFPLAFGLTPDFPPTALLHGLADDSVDASQSVNAEQALKKLGIEVLLETVEGKGHGFDIMEVSPDTDVDAFEPGKNPVVDSLRNIAQFLDKAAEKSRGT